MTYCVFPSVINFIGTGIAGTADGGPPLTSRTITQPIRMTVYKDTLHLCGLNVPCRVVGKFGEF